MSANPNQGPNIIQKARKEHNIPNHQVPKSFELTNSWTNKTHKNTNAKQLNNKSVHNKLHKLIKRYFSMKYRQTRHILDMEQNKQTPQVLIPVNGRNERRTPGTRNLNLLLSQFCKTPMEDFFVES